MRKLLAVLAVLVVVLALAAVLSAKLNGPLDVASDKKAETYVGVTYCGDSVEDGKLLIDRVKGYTNLFVLQSGTLQRNLASVDELGDYAVSSGLYFLPYFGSYVSSGFSGWLDAAKQRWGEHFLGVYYDDEPGGKMLDSYVEFKDEGTGDTIAKTQYGDVVVQKPSGVVVHYEISGVIHLFEPASLTDNSNFVNLQGNQTKTSDIYATYYPNSTINIATSNAITLEGSSGSNWSSLATYDALLGQRPFKNASEIAGHFYARNRANVQQLANSTRTFTSDYALYWFDYKAGYDVVLAQIGWNNSFAQNIALVRGAASMQNKEWGAILTWKYDAPPYLDAGPEIFNQMRTAYECGAKYIILFNYYDSASSPNGTLRDEHFLALENFWNAVVTGSSETFASVQAKSALVLPKDFGCGLRWKEDRIWGVIEPTDESHRIWGMVQSALANNNLQLDIIYDDSEYALAGRYHQVSYWNQTLS